MKPSDMNTMIRAWINGNRKDVAREAMRLGYEDLFTFVLALAKQAGAGEPVILARIMEIMK